MPNYRRVGDVPRKRHTLVRGPDGYVAEELMGTHGFSSASALLYHLHSPSAIVSVEPLPPPEVDERGESDWPLIPRHLRPRFDLVALRLNPRRPAFDGKSGVGIHMAISEHYVCVPDQSHHWGAIHAECRR